VDVEVDQPNLGVGDLRQRLAIYPRELERGDQRQAGRENAGGLMHRLDVLG
jgi:hypothetical protein